MVTRPPLPPEIRHRRLYAFFQSKVLNALMIAEISSLSLIGYVHSLLLPVLGASLAFDLFIIYSLWLWVKKPGHIVINNMLSDISGVFTLYFLVLALVNAESVGEIWYALPAVGAIIVMFAVMIRPCDKVFEI